MKQLVCYVDVVSPYAYLAFEALPQVLEGCSVAVDYRPVLFAGLLAHWGNTGPAEIEPKRAWTFRQVHWLAAQQGVSLQTPAMHPFNPLPLLRLALACNPALRPGRLVMETIFRHVWQGGADAVDPQRLASLTTQLKPVLDPAGDAVKQALRRNTDDAAAAGVFGVPSFALDGRVYWGLDALPMLREALTGSGDGWLAGPGWDAEGAPRAGVWRAVQRAVRPS